MTVKMVFKNKDAAIREVEIECSKASVASIAAWYKAFYLGDDYSVTVDGKRAKLDQNGEIINLPELLA